MGLVLISTVFSILNPVFLAQNNLVNLLFDCATVGVFWVNAGLSLPLAIMAALTVGA